jgi:hypothetical protein
MTIRLITVAALAACTGVKSNPNPGTPADAPPDHNRVDAPPDAPILLTQHHYIIDTQTLAATNDQARQQGLDLDNSGTVDNQLGRVMATLSQMGFGVQAPLDTAVDRGDILMLIDFEANGFLTSPARFTLFSGADPVPSPCNGAGDTTCRHHLGGNGSFAIAPGSPRDTELAGQMTNGTAITAAGTGHLHFQTVLLTAAPVTLDLIGARVKVTDPSATGIMTGIIAGGVSMTDVNTVLLPAWQQTFDAAMKADCPGAPPTCGCSANSTGKTLNSLFDANHDCTISLAELTNNSLVQSLVAPDVTLDGQQALSLGVAFAAVSATFAQ